jgi:hypothetical protein
VQVEGHRIDQRLQQRKRAAEPGAARHQPAQGEGDREVHGRKTQRFFSSHGTFSPWLIFQTLAPRLEAGKAIIMIIVIDNDHRGW